MTVSMSFLNLGSQQMKLPYIAFELPPCSQSHRLRSGRVYLTNTIAFGTVEIKTKHDLSRMIIY